MKKMGFLLLMVFIIGCQNKNNPEPVVLETSDTVEVKPTAIIEKTVVFLFPSPSELEALQEKYDEETYMEIIADLTWYPSLAGDLLDSLGIPNFISDKEYVLFMKSDQTEITWYRKESTGDMIVFHPEKDILITSSVDFDKDVILNYLK